MVEDGQNFLIGVFSVQRAGASQKADPASEPGQFPKDLCLAGQGLTSSRAALVPLERWVGQLDITHELMSISGRQGQSDRKEICFWLLSAQW